MSDPALIEVLESEPMFGLKSFKSVLEIRDFARKRQLNKTQADLRGAVKIAVIDDEKFQPLANLKSYGYNITLFDDISKISEIEGFDIVLSDLMGVGAHFDKTIGGASVIKEIKANYPTKIVIAYTGARANSGEAIAAKEHCDHFLKKDADLTEWSEMLDAFVQQVIDPYTMWLNARDGLLDLELDLRDVLKLEDAYVRSILSQDKDFKRLHNALSQADISGNAKGIVQGLISSVIYGLIFA